jgi:hypothetical protein
MSSPSNLYAEKIFAEHPLALWALDDRADYATLISEAQRDMTDALQWTVSANDVSVSSEDFEKPFPNSYQISLLGDVPSGAVDSVVCTSNELSFGLDELNEYFSNFSISSYIYVNSVYLSSFQIGYEYNKVSDNSLVSNLVTYSALGTSTWVHVSETFKIPESDAEDFRIIIKFNYVSGGSTPADYEFLVNGLSVGQWTEEFSATSLGQTTQAITDSISLTSLQNAIPADVYGLQDKGGYYLTKDNALVARNSGLPMVYGAESTTYIYPNGNNPSLIVPGFGFLNKVGEYQTFTFETWLRINPKNVVPRRIIGPIESEDGIYVDQSFIVLKIGNAVASHSIGEWYRPMLLDFRYSKDEASLLINGEQVISLSLSNATITLPEKYNNDSEDQDWIGFYSYNDITSFEIDCPAIYSYQVPKVLAKRRWVFGQGVEYPENINAAYAGTSVYVDYPFSNYSNNYNYPDLGRWSQGIVENLSTNANILTMPDYTLPTAVFEDGTTYESWISTNNGLQSGEPHFVRIKPDSGIPDDETESPEGYIYFEKLNVLTQPVKAFFGIFEEYVDTPGIQTLFYIEDELTNNYFEIKISSSDIEYVINYGSVEQTLATIPRSSIGQQFIVGIDIDKFSSTFGGNVRSFFNRVNSLSLYVGGRKTFENTTNAELIKLGFLNERNLAKVKTAFLDNGVTYPTFIDGGTPALTGTTTVSGGTPTTTTWQDFYDAGGVYEELFYHIASYTLIPKMYLDEFSLDIAIDAYWEDYVPLKYFAKYVDDSSNNKVYNLDFLQFNMLYPKLELFSQGVYDTTNAIVKSYISFQYLATGANYPESYFTEKVALSSNNVIDPGSSWQSKKYEVLNDTIIYPPTGVNFENLAIVAHLEIVVNGIVTYPLSIKTLQFASKSLNHTKPTAIGTRFGKEIYQYTKSGLSTNYKAKNPYIIYKNSSPYLFLTKNSGIQPIGTFSNRVSRGITIPVNTSLTPDFTIIAAQLSIRSNAESFSTEPVQIFEIQGKTKFTQFYMVATDSSGKRAKIYAIDASTGRQDANISFYLNGKFVQNPVISLKDWSVLGIACADPILFNSYVGAIRLTGPLVFNNISYYEKTDVQQIIQQVGRPWSEVLQPVTSPVEWTYWDESTWREVLNLRSVTEFDVDPSSIYRAYTGTNKVIAEDDKVLSFLTYEYLAYKDVSWQTQTIKPV